MIGPLYPPPLRFTVQQMENACSVGRFNCGPGALCAVLGLSIDEFQALPAAKEFIQKGCTTPTLMKRFLCDCSLRHRTIWEVQRRKNGEKTLPWPDYGIARIQWGGPWCDPGAHPKARYRHTHWVGAFKEITSPRVHVFDINAVGTVIHDGIKDQSGSQITGWLPESEWSGWVVRGLTNDISRWDGTWFLTHAIEVRP